MKTLFTRYVIILLTAQFMIACSSDSGTQARSVTDQEKYINAIKDAMVADSFEISHSLIAITDSNRYLVREDTGSPKRVLVVTWTKHIGSYIENANVVNSWGEVWVTVVPELKDWFRTKYTDGNNFVLRCEQLLGLPIGCGYTHFVELWVRPADLFRPAADNEITDNTAGIDYPVGMDSAYRAWFDSNILYSYFPMRYPWTRLGYTYDWGGTDSEYGLSEFVIRRGSTLTVRKIYTNSELFGTLGN